MINNYKNNFKINRIIAALVVAAILVCMLVTSFGALNTQALINEDEVVTFEEYSKTHTIENKTEFIGSYLIHIDAMNDELYEKAMATQEKFSQFDIYYKNEMQNGEWFDITSGDGIASLGSSGVKADAEKMNPLYITYVVGSDGALVNAKTGEKEGLYDKPNPYDLSKLPEFENVKAYSDRYYDVTSTGVGEYIYQVMDEFWKSDLHNDITDACDRRLLALQPVYDSLVASNQKEQADILNSLMKKIDSTRRAEVYYMLSESDYHFYDSESGETGPARVELLLQSLYGDFYDDWCDDNKHFDLNDFLRYANGVANDSDTEAANIDTNNKQKQENRDKANKTYEDGVDALKEQYPEWDIEGTPDYDAYVEAEKDLAQERDDALAEIGDDEEPHDPFEVDMARLDSQTIGTPFEDGVFDKEQFVIDDSLTDLVNTALSDCAKAYNTYSADALSDPDTIIGSAEYDYSQAVIDAAEGGLDAVQTQLGMLQVIYNIKDNQVKDNDAELNIINGSLLGKGLSKYGEELSKGVSTEFLAAKNQSNAANAGDDILDEQESGIESARSELEFIISAKHMRMAPADALASTEEQINNTDALYKTIPSDDMKAKATSSVDAHMEWLKKELERIKSLDESLASDMDKLEEQKEALQDEKLDALYNDDMNLANRIDAQIDAIDDAINAEEQKQNAILDDPNASAAEKAAASDALGKTGSNAANGSDNSDVADLSAGSGDGGAGNGGDSGDSSGAGNAGDAGAGSGDGSGAGNAGDAGNSSGDSGANSGNGGKGNGSGLNADDINGLIADLFGDDFGNLSDDDKAAVVAALDKFGEDKGDNTASNMAKAFGNQLAKEGNPFLSTLLYDSKEGLFISLETIGTPKLTQYRYGFDASRKTGTMVLKGKAYEFVSGSSSVRLNKKTENEMKYKSRFKDKAVYIPEASAEEYFGVNGHRLYSLDYAIILNSKEEAKCDELYDALCTMKSEG